MLRLLGRRMSPTAARLAAQRTRAIGQHMMSTTPESTVLFESNKSIRKFILNRPNKLNALDTPMLELLRPKILEWNSSDLCGAIVGTGAGRAFCAGGDVATVVENASDPTTRPLAIDFFKKEFEVDYILASLKKPYVAILDGITMGGGVGLTANALFRVATEKTLWAMPETKIGYSPDVGGSYFLSRLDGEIGTYLGLTGESLSGRAVFEHGLATHFLPSRRIPLLLERLSELDDPSAALIDKTIEEMSCEREPNEPRSLLTGGVRAALDAAFRHNEVEQIFASLEELSQVEDASIKQWAQETLQKLNQRSPTSLKVALAAIRRGKKLDLAQAMAMELRIAGAFCNGASPDFKTGVETVIKTKSKDVPAWSPSKLEDVAPEAVSRFFDSTSSFIQGLPALEIPQGLEAIPDNRHLKYALPTEAEIGAVVKGSHPGAGDMGWTAEEVQTFFSKQYPGKHGVREKVEEVLQRRCTIIDNVDGNFVWLKWNA
ncbi:3-hydroxyisobutyryl-Coenzyme A hydrolase isoform 1 [Coprinopsis cinerea okayama7|uniref:3-hydroxyisobutyryl-CoA hydrolase n=1 Tax=Coprinopsis cinerea (strain Okayama-7 / 130 / ATCC MYA-4618 / FGSC 9003) TaxID=240176 RepID=A8NEJ7_COPC7|nr:3-hydroxyisobutyryl-Coenzyme A hydrolase isoform 1 [Coprinopsis cinerea okayama7\|eukprot:XP_001833049.2 3-hydroxyisobutyryl-Coenzyme A hydrolase isoform 1 [Coprinopsis cinerea okayama7\